MVYGTCGVFGDVLLVGLQCLQSSLICIRGKLSIVAMLIETPGARNHFTLSLKHIAGMKRPNQRFILGSPTLKWCILFCLVVALWCSCLLRGTVSSSDIVPSESCGCCWNERCGCVKSMWSGSKMPVKKHIRRAFWENAGVEMPVMLPYASHASSLIVQMDPTGLNQWGNQWEISSDLCWSLLFFWPIDLW